MTQATWRFGNTALDSALTWHALCTEVPYIVTVQDSKAALQNPRVQGSVMLKPLW